MICVVRHLTAEQSGREALPAALAQRREIFPAIAGKRAAVGRGCPA
jgi:hypothetical protein